MPFMSVLPWIFALAALTFRHAPAQTDPLNLLVEYSRSTRFMARPPDTTEIWIGENAAAIRRGEETVILRYDLNTILFVRPAQEAYYERPLDTKPPGEPAADTSIHTKGWQYAPVYDWTVEDTGEEKDLQGFACHHYVARGEADYASRTLDLWITKESPIRLDRYNDRRFWAQIPGDPRTAELLQAFPELYSSVIISCTEKFVPSIAPEGTIERRIVYVERKPPPANTFDVPSGFKRFQTRAEYLNAH